MKKLMLVGILLCFGGVLAQTEVPLDLPKVTPTSPEAGTLGRFGNVPIDPSTGQMSFTVPIHTIGVDGNSWPVALQYNYGGFILEAKPSLAGWGWSLNAYGSITKQVRGLPDGHENGYYGENNVKNIIDTYAPSGDFSGMAMTDFLGFVDGSLDSEIDKYSVNIGRVSFAFKIRQDANGDPEPYYLSKHNHKVTDIELDPLEEFAVKSFEVTDDSGVIYHFDEDDREQVISGLDNEFQKDKTTAWMLSKIEYLNGQTIEFDYSKENFTNWDFVARGISAEGDLVQGGQATGVLMYTASYGDEMRESLIERQILNEIIFPKGKIEFSYLLKNNPNRKVIEQILLKDHNSNVVNDFDLTYESDRDALVDIFRNGERYFGFEYHGVSNTAFIPGFPNNASDKPLDQDYWKYYNGTGNDKAIHIGNGITAFKEPVFQLALKGAMTLIEYPTGGSTEISYSQNQVKKLYTETNGNALPPFNLEMDLPFTAGPTLSSVSETITFDYPVRASLYHFAKGPLFPGNEIHLAISSTANENDYVDCFTSPPSYQSGNYATIISLARPLVEAPTEECPYYPNPIIKPVLTIDYDVDNGCPLFSPGCVEQDKLDLYADSGGDFWVMPGTYTFTISGKKLVDDPDDFNDDILEARIHLQYYDPDPNGNGDPGEIYVNQNIGGIRVASITNHPLQGDRVTTYFDYNDDEGFSTAFESQIPYVKEEFDLTVVWPDNSLTSRTESNHNLNAFGSLDAANGVPVYYKRIKKYTKVNYEFVPLPPGRSYTVAPLPADINTKGFPVHRVLTPLGEWPPIVIDDNGTSGTLEPSYPEGYTILTYDPPAEETTYIYPLVPRHIDKTRARLDRDEKFDESEISVASTDNEYAELRLDHMAGPNYPNEYDADNNHPWSFKLVWSADRWVYLNDPNKCYEENNQNCEASIKELHTLQKYRETEKSQLLYQTVSENQGVAITTYTTYDFNNNFYPLEQKVTTSNGEEIKTEFEYPFDLTSENQYDLMVGKNQLSVAVRTKQYRETDLLSTQKINFIANVNGYKPGDTEVAKGTDTPEVRISIEGYDSDGNITQLRKANDVVISYLYGYSKNYPVAEIVGATHGEAVTALALEGHTYNSEIGFQSYDGTTLIDALKDMRDRLNLTDNVQVTIYTYKPLIGVSTVTDPRGYTTEYIYDTQNRLMYVKDEDGKVLQRTQYNYQNGN